ncbi:MAG: WGxxGxxG-CTERM domain-containing protein [Timaviella obliquedivisa GSE-PSE-MK23-08B]|jgi:MYXO-CTERM domain-containing protein|nr:WGxxGxxG-CTERM domain-containing protein [Timaviella obliquedivisa GSE-PSE-MK23-08B]
MKLSQFSKPLWATAIALSVGTLQVLPAAAQTGTTDTAPGTTAPGSIPDATAPGTTTDPTIIDTTVDNDDGFDWGWLGLLGLIGLAGLRKPEEREVYRDPGIDPARTTTRTSDYNR